MGGVTKHSYHTHTHAYEASKLKSLHSKSKRNTEILLHVFGGQGKRGVLDLSQYASQNFHFVSEDLEIKSNTPQVSEI